jgi:hypothetical protein
VTDLMNRIAASRPTDADLDAAWPLEDRAALLDRVRAQSSTERRRPWLRGGWLAAAAAIAAVVLVLPVLNGGNAQARVEILRLASVASNSEGLIFGPGTYIHVKTKSVQENSRLFGDGQRRDTDREAWVRWDGAEWAIDTRPSAGWTEYQRFAAPTKGNFDSPTPEFVAQLPDRSAALRNYLNATVSGSNSHDQALFVAVTDLASSHLLDPGTLAVALKAIADVDGVKTKDTVVEGRDAVEISYRRFYFGLFGVDSFTIDKKTAQVLQVTSSSPGGTYTSTTTMTQTVDEIPANVLAAYDRYGDGTRICGNGRQATGDGEC